MFQRHPDDPFYIDENPVDVDARVSEFVNRDSSGRMRSAMAHLAYSYNHRQAEVGSWAWLSDRFVEKTLHYGFFGFLPQIRSRRVLKVIRITKPIWVVPFLVLWFIPIAMFMYCGLAVCHLLASLR